MRFRVAIALWLAVVLVGTVDSRQASAESYPSRRINLIVPFPAGSATDAVTRRLAESIRTETGVTVLVENKPGADGNLAALAVLNAGADGYTVFVTTNSTQAANVNLFNAMPYDPKADFAPVAGIMTIPMMLAVKPEFPAKTVAEFIALAKSRQKPLSFGSGNTSSRGAAELFRSRAGIEMQHVPYRGMPQALTDVLAGEVDCVFAQRAAGGSARCPDARTGRPVRGGAERLGRSLRTVRDALRYRGKAQSGRARLRQQQGHRGLSGVRRRQAVSSRPR